MEGDFNELVDAINAIGKVLSEIRDNQKETNERLDEINCRLNEINNKD